MPLENRKINEIVDLWILLQHIKSVISEYYLDIKSFLFGVKNLSFLMLVSFFYGILFLDIYIFEFQLC